MKKMLLTKKQTWYYVDNEKRFGVHNFISGNVSGIRGDVDKCEITDKERENGINISALIND